METYCTVYAEGEDIASINHVMQCDSAAYDKGSGAVHSLLLMGLQSNDLKMHDFYVFFSHCNSRHVTAYILSKVLK